MEVDVLFVYRSSWSGKPLRVWNHSGLNPYVVLQRTHCTYQYEYLAGNMYSTARMPYELYFLTSRSRTIGGKYIVEVT